MSWHQILALTNVAKCQEGLFLISSLTQKRDQERMFLLLLLVFFLKVVGCSLVDKSRVEGLLDDWNL